MESPRNVFHRAQRPKTIVLMAMALVLGYFLSCQNAPNLPPLPTAVGRICTWDVPAGQSYTFVDAPGNLAPVPFIARVYHPGIDTACTTFDRRLHPLVVFGHGRYLPGIPDNYLGMTYLMDHLASWGDICISVNLDVVSLINDNARGIGIPHRAELLLNAVEFMAKECRTPGSVFYKRVDTTRIALVGHSRGGGGALYAVNYNSTRRNRPIKAVCTISPVNFGVAPMSVAVPHLTLYGSWDGDVYDGQGPDIWARGSRAADKEMVEVYGANHYYFTDNMLFAGETEELTRAQHQTISKGFINAWLDTYLRGNNRWDAYLKGRSTFEPAVGVSISYLDAHFQTIDNADPLGTPLVNNLGGNNVPTGLPAFLDFGMATPPDYQAGPALRTTWKAGQDRLAFRFGPTNFSTFPFLGFRLSQVHPDNSNPVDRYKDFSVKVGDAAGHQATVILSNYLGGLPYPDLSGSIPAANIYNRKQLMRSFRIPKTDFPGVDFSQLNRVEFIFDRPNSPRFANNKGTIKIDDLEFTD